MTTKATHEEWAKRIERWNDSGLTAKEFASETGLNVSSMRWWKWQLGKQASTLPQASETRRKRRQKVEEPTAALTFVEVTAPPASAALEIVLKTGRNIRVPTGFDEATLARLLVVLERSS